jgi:hypothetical protein
MHSSVPSLYPDITEEELEDKKAEWRFSELDIHFRRVRIWGYTASIA